MLLLTSVVAWKARRTFATKSTGSRKCPSTGFSVVGSSPRRASGSSSTAAISACMLPRSLATPKVTLPDVNVPLANELATRVTYVGLGLLVTRCWIMRRATKGRQVGVHKDGVQRILQVLL